MARPVLYAHPGACSRVTMSALEETGADYDIKWIDLSSKKNYSEDYLALNRKGKVPALVVDGVTLTENAAILHFLHVANPGARLLPRSGNPAVDAQGLSDLAWCGGMLHPMVRQIRNPQRWTLNAGETAGIRADGMDKLLKECAYIDTRFKASEWWYGADWSIVDVYLYWACSTAAKSGFPVKDFAGISAHATRVRERQSFQRALAKEIAAINTEGIGVDRATL